MRRGRRIGWRGGSRGLRLPGPARHSDLGRRTRLVSPFRFRRVSRRRRESSGGTGAAQVGANRFGRWRARVVGEPEKSRVLPNPHSDRAASLRATVGESADSGRGSPRRSGSLSNRRRAEGRPQGIRWHDGALGRMGGRNRLGRGQPTGGCLVDLAAGSDPRADGARTGANGVGSAAELVPAGLSGRASQDSHRRGVGRTGWGVDSGRPLEWSVAHEMDHAERGPGMGTRAAEACIATMMGVTPRWTLPSIRTAAGTAAGMPRFAPPTSFPSLR